MRLEGEATAAAGECLGERMKDEGEARAGREVERSCSRSRSAPAEECSSSRALRTLGRAEAEKRTRSTGA